MSTRIMIFFTILILICCLPNKFCQAEQDITEVKECRERERLVTSEKDDLYSLVDIFEGQTLILMCRFCNEEANDRPKNWLKVAQLGVSPATEVKPDMNNDVNQNRISINHKHSLIIGNFSEEDAGLYFCVNFEDQTNSEKINYLVDLVFPNIQSNPEKGSITDWSKYHDDFFASVNNLFNQSDGQQFVYLRNVLGIKAELVTQWAPWGPCEACGRPQGEGVMKKTGKCRIKLAVYEHSKQNNNLTDNEKYLLQAAAISCRSKKLSRMFPLISNYTRNIPDFILEDRCTSICNPDAEGINTGWKVGKGKGFKYKKRSVLQENSHLTTVCPESSLNNKVVWKKNGRTLKRGDNSNPHVIVDTFNTLYLIEITPPDADNYTCYVDDIRMQQITVFVYGKSKILTMELLRYLIYLGFILFLSSFCYCAGLVITWQRRHLFKTYDELKAEEPQRQKENDELESFL